MSLGEVKPVIRWRHSDKYGCWYAWLGGSTFADRFIAGEDGRDGWMTEESKLLKYALKYAPCNT